MELEYNVSIKECNTDELENNLAKLIEDIRSSLSKRRYKKVLKDIEAKEHNFFNSKLFWKLRELKIRALLKIVNKKLFHGDNNLVEKKSIEKWLTKLDYEVETWSKNLEPSKDYSIEIEMLVQVFLELIHCFAIYSKNEEQLTDSAAFLGVGERLIKSFIENSKEAKTFNIAQKIYLFISSILISDNDYESAKVYQTLCLKLCFRELFLRIDVNAGLNLDCVSNFTCHYLNKTFTNIVIAFYQRGVSEENLGCIVKAIEAYKQSRWFALKFIKAEIPELAQFVNDVEKRSFNYHYLLKGIKEKKEDSKKKDKEEKTKPRVKSAVVMNRLSDPYDLSNVSKFDKLIPLIESLQIPELELNAGKSGFILSTLHTINDLLSQEFKDIVTNMDRIEINNLDKETREKIQRRLNEIRIIKKNTSREKFSRKTPSIIKQEDSTNCENVNNKTQNFFNGHPSFFIASDSNKKPNTVRSHSVSLSKNVEKYRYNPYVFSKSYQKKKNFIEKLGSKEINFQKQLLKIKKFEKIDVNNSVDTNKIKGDAQNFFIRSLGSKMSNAKLNSHKVEVNDQYQPINSVREKLEKCAILSLDTKKTKELNNYIRSERSKKFTLREEFANKSSKKNHIDEHTVLKQNDEILRTLCAKLELIEKSEDILKRKTLFNEVQLYQKSKTRSIKINSKDMSHFIKIVNDKVK